MKARRATPAAAIVIKIMNCSGQKGKFCMTSHVWHKKVLTESYNLCRKGIGQTSSFRVILLTNVKLVKHWSEIILICYSKKYI